MGDSWGDYSRLDVSTDTSEFQVVITGTATGGNCV